MARNNRNNVQNTDNSVFEELVEQENTPVVETEPETIVEPLKKEPAKNHNKNKKTAVMY